MGLAAMRMVFTPALQSAVPVLVTDREALQAINGLFDATWRLARLIGPMLAAVLNTLLPVIHFLSVTAVGFVLSGLADLGGARPRWSIPRSQPQPEPRRLARRLGRAARRRAPDAERAHDRRAAADQRLRQRPVERGAAALPSR